MLYATGYRWYYGKWGIFFLNVVNLLPFWVRWWQLSVGPRYLTDQEAGFGRKSGLGEIASWPQWGHLTIFFSLKNFKKPSRPYYPYTSYRASTIWLSSGKAAARFPTVERWNMSPCCGLVPGTQGEVSQEIKPVWLNKHLFDACCVWAIMLDLGVQRSRIGGLCPQRAHCSVMKMEK